MVATRRSLGGGGGSSPSPSPAADTEPLTKAQQAQLKKLNISGTDALKGEDLKAVQAARENLPTYHWRGASYLQDENTDAAWVDNQPERYLKRSREAGLDDGDGVEGRTATAVEEEEDDEDEDEEDEEEEDEEDEEEEDEEEDEDEDEDEEEDEEEEEEEEEAPPLKRRKFEQDHELEPYIEAIRKSHADRLNARAARGERLQKPSREEAAAAVATSSPSSAKKASKIAEDTGDHNMNTARSDNVENGRGKKRTRKQSAIDDEEEEQPTKRRASQNEVHARSLPSSADLDRIDKEKKRSKKEAARKNLKTKPLREEDMYSEGEQRRQKVVKLAEVQKELIETTEDWHFAKEQLEKARAYNAARRAAQQAGAQDTQQPIDLSEDATEHDNRDEDMVDERLEREQQQHSGSASQDQHDDGSKAADTPLDEVDDGDSGVNAVTEAEQVLYTPNDSYKQHQQTADATMAAPSEAPTHPSGEMSPPPQTTSGASRTSPSAPAPLDTPSSNSSANSSNDSKTSTTSAERNTFASLPPGAELPTTSAGGDPLRWTIQQRLSAETGRDQYALDMGRLQGETKQARRRRIARERAVVGSWAKITGADIVELKAAGSED